MSYEEGTLKRGKTVEDREDLISNLPRGVIDGIIERLPLTDVAKMSILSRKWHDIWLSIQKLTFDAHFFTTVLKDKLHDTHEFSSIVSKILFHHEGRHLLGFNLYVPPLNSYPDVTQWISYLSKTPDVSDIAIHNHYKLPLKLSFCIFRCVNLRKLKLHQFVINPLPRHFVGFRKMTCLELDKVTLTEKTFRCLLHACPLLEKLRLTNFIGLDHIIIDCPRLSHLIVDGAFISLDARNAQNLVSALFGLQKWVQVCHKASLRALVQALATSCNLRKLSCRGHFCKALYTTSLLPTAFEKLATLELTSIALNEAHDFSSIITAIRSCPAIERLYISVSTSKHVTVTVTVPDPDNELLRLCYADVKICRGSSMELKLIEYLLACSPFLKKFTVTSAGDSKQVFRPGMMIQLIRFRRASQKVEVVCHPEPVASVIFDSSDTDSSSSSSSDAAAADADSDSD